LRILITNDDGIDAPGLVALERELLKSGASVVVVAPDSERSAASHSVSLRKPVKIEERGPERWAVSGTPVDTVNLAVNHLIRDKKPDMVISGVNRGANLGCDIHYSGTVAAAREACLLGLPAAAVSLETTREDADFGPSARFAVTLANMMGENNLPPRTLLNANLPDIPEEEMAGVMITVMGIRKYTDTIDVHNDDNGDSYYTIGGPPLGGEPIPGSDIEAVKNGYISVTPLRLDYTNDCVLDWLRERMGGES